MKDSLIVETLKAYFSLEVANHFMFGANEIIVDTKDGARIRLTAIEY